LIAFLGTEACITKLLDKCEEPAAVDALGKADLGALQYLLPALPTPEGAVTPRQLAAYQGAWRICRLGAPRSRDWWGRAKPDERKQELDRVHARADAVLEYWRQIQGGQ
jgi:hypothetical protein